MNNRIDSCNEIAGAAPVEVPCSTHPDAPHGFNRTSSHSLDRYVCDCEGWMPPEPIGEEVEVVGWRVVTDATGISKVYGNEPSWAFKTYGDFSYRVDLLMTVTQHQRIVGELTAGINIGRNEIERLKAERDQLKADKERLQKELDGQGFELADAMAEVERLNQITKVSAMDDYAEVDRIRAELATAWSNAEKNARGYDDLRAQLAAQTVVLPTRAARSAQILRATPWN